jgi:hypothetical protein
MMQPVLFMYGAHTHGSEWRPCPRPVSPGNLKVSGWFHFGPAVRGSRAVTRGSLVMG